MRGVVVRKPPALDDDLRQRRRVGREAQAQRGDLGQRAGVERLGDGAGEIGLAAALVGEEERLDDEPAGLRLGQRGRRRLEEPAVGLSGEELVAVDEPRQRALACAAKRG